MSDLTSWLHEFADACEIVAAGRWPGPRTAARLREVADALAAAKQQGQVVAWADEWRAAVAAKLSSYGLSEEAAAVFAASELDEYRAGLCDCAENDPADMVDLMMGVARDAIEIWKTESAGRPFGHKDTAPPPSVPVVPDWITGDGMQGIKAEAHFLTQHTDETVQRVGRRLIERVDKIIAALAQQPAAPTLAKHQPCGCVICTCEDERQCQGCGAKHCGNRADHPPYVAQQPAAVDEVAAWTDEQCIEFMRVALRHAEYKRGNGGPTVDDIRMGQRRAAALAAQTGGVE